MKIKNKPLFALSILLFLSLLIICINDWQRPFFPGNEGIEIILFVFLIPPAIAFYLSVESSKSKDGISPNVIFYIPMLVGLLFYLIVRWNGVQELEKDHKIVKGVVTHNFLRHGKGPPTEMIEFRFEVGGASLYEKEENLAEPLFAGDSIFVKYAIKDPRINEFWPLQE